MRNERFQVDEPARYETDRLGVLIKASAVMNYWGVEMSPGSPGSSNGIGNRGQFGLPNSIRMGTAASISHESRIGDNRRVAV